MRQKPFKELASRTIGFKIGNVQPVGLEGAFDQSLRGESGKRLMQKYPVTYGSHSMLRMKLKQKMAVIFILQLI